MKRWSLLVALWLVAGPALAWRLSGEPNDIHRWFPGDLPAPYAFNSIHDEPAIPGTEEREEVRQAFQTWAAACDSRLSFMDAGLTSTAGHGYDGESVITFADPYDDLAPGVLGLTYTYFDTGTFMETRGRHFYRIVESDIVFAEDHLFTTHEGAGITVLAKDAKPNQGGFGLVGPGNNQRPNARIDGFKVTSHYSKTEKSGAVIVHLTQSQQQGAMFTLVYEGLTEEEGLTTAKKFNWKEMKKSVDTLF